MLLKIGYKRGWTIIEGFGCITFEPFDRNKDAVVFDEAYLEYFEIMAETGGVPYIVALKSDKQNESITPTRILLTMDDGRIITILIDTETYLLNDNGKTIERIN